MNERFNVKSLYRWIVLAILVAFAYLFALNGRYMNAGVNRVMVFDKWTNRMYLPEMK